MERNLRVRTGLTLGIPASVGVGWGIFAAAVALTGHEPGVTAYQQLLASAVLAVAVPVCAWSVVVARRDRGALAWILTTLVISVATAGIASALAIADTEATSAALAASEAFRQELESDLADAYWDWHRASGGADTIYTGDKSEWWSLDPGGDSRPPLWRLLNDYGWGGRITVDDLDGDGIVDHLGWEADGPWCAPVGGGGTHEPRWHEATPGRCA